jgi:hypothetical protein
MSFIAFAESRYGCTSFWGTTLSARSSRYHVGDRELVELHLETGRRGDGPRERLARGLAIVRLAEEHQIVALTDARLHRRAHQRSADAPAPMLGNDVHLGPAGVRILGLVLVPPDERRANERARCVACGEGRPPLIGRRRGDALHERVDRRERIFRHPLVVLRLEQTRGFLELGARGRGEVDLGDLVPVCCLHSLEPRRQVRLDYVGRYVRLGTRGDRLEDEDGRAEAAAFAPNTDGLAKPLEERSCER